MHKNSCRRLLPAAQLVKKLAYGVFFDDFAPFA
jgi:hypothetical protein